MAVDIDEVKNKLWESYSKKDLSPQLRESFTSLDIDDFLKDHSEGVLQNFLDNKIYFVFDYDKCYNITNMGFGFSNDHGGQVVFREEPVFYSGGGCSPRRINNIFALMVI